MKHLLSALALAALAGCGGGGGGGSVGGATPFPAQPLGAPATDAPKSVEPAKAPEVEEPPVPLPTKCRIVIYGDSIARGEPLIAEGPKRRIEMLNPLWEVDLRAVAGSTGSDDAVRLLHDPRDGFHVAIAQWGYNDMVRLRDVEPIRAFVKQLQSEGMKVVLTGVIQSPNKLHDLYDGKLRQMAIDTGAAFASWGERPIQTVDGVHPDQMSSNLLVDDLLTTLRQECPQ